MTLAFLPQSTLSSFCTGSLSAQIVQYAVLVKSTTSKPLLLVTLAATRTKNVKTMQPPPGLRVMIKSTNQLHILDLDIPFGMPKSIR